MSEKLPNRRETAASQFEQSENYQAMQQLKYIGVAKGLNQLNLFHGRASDANPNWQVDPSFDNSGNNTGNRNINKKPALNTSDYQTASRFAVARAREYSSEAEIHRIMSDDPDAVVFDDDSLSSLNRKQMEMVNRAISKTLPGITEGSPLSFEDRHALDYHRPNEFKNRHGLMFDGEIKQLSERLGLKTRVVSQIGSAINTEQLLKSGYIQDICRAFLDNQTTVTINIAESGQHSVPINHEYLSRWFKNNHIVGYKQKVSSATLNHQLIDNYLLFDLEKVNTNKELERRVIERNRRLGKIAIMAYQKNSEQHHASLVGILSKNPYIKPKDIIKLAKLTPGYKEIFESRTGNWEGYKLEEHTETVLDLFDKNYADKIPAALLPTMRLALLVHDIGKPEAFKYNEKTHQKQYNLAFADSFLRQNKVDNPSIQLIETMIGEGMEWTERWMVRKEKNIGMQFYQFCENAMKRYLKVDRVDNATVNGFRNMLEILQTCDSGAYTTMGITRSADNGVIYRNYGSFNESFKPNKGRLTNDRVEMKRGAK